MHNCRRQNGSWAAKVLCVVALCLALPASAWAEPPTSRGSVRLNSETPKRNNRLYHKSYAVVIGIDNYQYICSFQRRCHNTRYRWWYANL